VFIKLLEQVFLLVQRKSVTFNCEGAKTMLIGTILGFVVGSIYCIIGSVFHILSKNSLGPSSVGVVTLGILARIMFGVFASVGVIGLAHLSNTGLICYCVVLMIMSGVVHPILSIKE